MGTLPLEQLIQPAIDLAEKGYVVTEKQARSFKRYSDLFVEVNGEDTFFAQDYKVGDTIVNPALAKTLKAIARNGNAGFYEGWVAEAMVNKTRATGGLLSLDDLKSTKPNIEPIGPYKGEVDFDGSHQVEESV